MDINKKKVLITDTSLFPPASGGSVREDAMDFRLRKDILDRIKTLRNISRVSVIVSNDGLTDDALEVLRKEVEYLIFIYCKVAVRTFTTVGDAVDALPHNLQRRDAILEVGEKRMADYDFIRTEDFV